MVVVVSLLRDKSFFVVSRLDRRGQSSWSVVFRDQSAFFVLVVVTSCVVGRDRPSRRRLGFLAEYLKIEEWSDIGVTHRRRR